MDKYVNVQWICFCTVPATPLMFEAFIRAAFPIQRYLAGFWCINVSLGAKGTRGEKLRGPLLL
jgi:hypothetical protein